jgi:hypothetical protein
MDLKMLAEAPPWEWPGDAGETILESLGDRDADQDERLLAAELAGDFVVIDDELAMALVSLAEDGEEPGELRGQAAISLGPALEHVDTFGFEDEDDIVITEEVTVHIQRSLEALHGDDRAPAEVRRHALEASVRAPQDWHREAISRAYSRAETDWKRTAVFCMRFVRGFDEAIVESLESPDAVTHGQAILAAANWELEVAWPHVAALLYSEGIDKSLLLAAIEAVPLLRPREASVLLAPFVDSEDEDIVDAVQEAREMTGGLLDEEPDWDPDDDDAETIH